MGKYQEVYRHAFTLVLHSHADILYSGLDEIICDNFQKNTKVLVDTTDALLIEEILHQWNRHCKVMYYVSNLVMYMDKTFCDIKHKLRSHDLSMCRFKEIILTDKIVLKRLISQILSIIQKQRNGEEKIDESSISNVLRMIVDVDNYCEDYWHRYQPLSASYMLQDTRFMRINLNGWRDKKGFVYDTGFEQKYIEDLQLFYSIESQKVFAEYGNISDYMIYAEKRIIEEVDRVNRFFPSEKREQTRNLVKNTVEKELIECFVNQFIQNKNGLRYMLDKIKIEDLNRLYRLLKRINMIKMLEKEVYKYFQEVGSSIQYNQGSTQVEF